MDVTISKNYTLSISVCFNNCIVLRSHLVIVLLSLGGLPPVASFYAKVLLFKGLLSSSMYVIALLLLIFSLLSVFYYIRIIKVVLFYPVNSTVKNKWLFYPISSIVKK